jgi:hypothetical protein
MTEIKKLRMLRTEMQVLVVFLSSWVLVVLEFQSCILNETVCVLFQKCVCICVCNFSCFIGCNRHGIIATLTLE